MWDDIFAFSFDMTPEEIIEYLKAKGLSVSFDWSDLWGAANNRSFTVAKMLQLDLLKDVQDSLTKAVEKGETFDNWKRKLQPELIDKGWWGKVPAKDVPGFDQGMFPEIDPEREVQLGSNNRMKTIFYTNRSVSYSQGRYKRLLENADARPYWMYQAVEDERTRKSHMELSGKIWRSDNPIWQRIFPPNDWGCRCLVRALNEQEMKAEGLKVSFNMMDDDVSKYVSPEWDYNAGANDLGLEKRFFEKLQETDPKIQAQIIKEALRERNG